MRATVAALSPILELWMSGFRLPDLNDPMYPVEEADMDIVKDFFALLLVSAESVPASPLAAVRAYLPDFPEFPTRGLPSDALVVLGVARPSGPTVELRSRLSAALDAEQAASYLVLAGGF